jgi:hypothetical protein
MCEPDQAQPTPGEPRTIRTVCRVLVAIAERSAGAFVILLMGYMLAEVLEWPDVPTTTVLIFTVIAGCAASLASIAAVACWTIIQNLGRRLDVIERHLGGAVVVVGRGGQADRANGSAPTGLDPQSIEAARRIARALERAETPPPRL